MSEILDGSSRHEQLLTLPKIFHRDLALIASLDLKAEEISKKLNAKRADHLHALRVRRKCFPDAALPVFVVSGEHYYDCKRTESSQLPIPPRASPAIKAPCFVKQDEKLDNLKKEGHSVRSQQQSIPCKQSQNEQPSSDECDNEPLNPRNRLTDGSIRNKDGRRTPRRSDGVSRHSSNRSNSGKSSRRHHEQCTREMRSNKTKRRTSNQEDDESDDALLIKRDTTKGHTNEDPLTVQKDLSETPDTAGYETLERRLTLSCLDDRLACQLEEIEKLSNHESSLHLSKVEVVCKLMDLVRILEAHDGEIGECGGRRSSSRHQPPSWYAAVDQTQEEERGRVHRKRTVCTRRQGTVRSQKARSRSLSPSSSVVSTAIPSEVSTLGGSTQQKKLRGGSAVSSGRSASLVRKKHKRQPMETLSCALPGSASAIHLLPVPPRGEPGEGHVPRCSPQNEVAGNIPVRRPSWSCPPPNMVPANVVGPSTTKAPKRAVLPTKTPTHQPNQAPANYSTVYLPVEPSLLYAPPGALSPEKHGGLSASLPPVQATRTNTEQQNRPTTVNESSFNAGGVMSGIPSAGDLLLSLPGIHPAVEPTIPGVVPIAQNVPCWSPQNGGFVPTGEERILQRTPYPQSPIGKVSSDRCASPSTVASTPRSMCSRPAEPPDSPEQSLPRLNRAFGQRSLAAVKQSKCYKQPQDIPLEVVTSNVHCATIPENNYP